MWKYAEVVILSVFVGIVIGVYAAIIGGWLRLG